VWGYDKRFFTTPEVVARTPLIPLPPPWAAGKYKFVEGNAVDKVKHDSIVQMVRQMNRGIATLKSIKDLA
jgi:hypothetical protein